MVKSYNILTSALLYHVDGQILLQEVSCLYSSHFCFPSHVLLRPRPCRTFHPVAVRPKTPGGNNYPVQL